MTKARDIVEWLVNEERKQVLDAEIRLMTDNPTQFSFILKALEGTGILRKSVTNKAGIRIYEVDYDKIVRYYPDLESRIPSWWKEQRNEESAELADSDVKALLDAKPVQGGEQE